MAVREMNDALRETTTSFQEVDNALLSTGQQLMNARASFLFSSFAMMAMAQVVDQLTSKFADLQRTMVDTFSSVQYQAVTTATVLTGSAQDYEKVMERMLELGRETEYTAVEAGEGMETLARAGLETAETISIIEPVLEMARANNMAVGEAARFAAGMFRAWGLEAQEMNAELEELNVNSSQAERNLQNVSMVSATVTHAARNSRQEVNELAQALRFASAAAQTVGWELEEVTVGMMAAADSMIEAGMAGRSFRRLMTRVGMVAGDTGRGIQQARDMMAEYNIQLQDSKGEMVGFIDLIEQLERETANMTSTQRVNLYQQLAGMRGMNALAAAVERGSDEMREQETQLKATAAAGAMYAELGGDVRQEIIEITKAVRESNEYIEGSVSYYEDIRRQFDLSHEAAAKLNEVLTDTNHTKEELLKILEDITVVSEMVSARLETLQGSIVLLESSLEVLWASLAEGTFEEVMTSWYELLRDISDAISNLPGPLRATIAMFILFGSVFNRIVPPIVMFISMLTIQKAAIASLRLEEYEMLKARTKAMAQFPQYNKLMQKKIYQDIQNLKVKQLEKIVTKDNAVMQQLESKSKIENTKIAQFANKIGMKSALADDAERIAKMKLAAAYKLHTMEIQNQVPLLAALRGETQMLTHEELQEFVVRNANVTTLKKSQVETLKLAQMKDILSNSTRGLTASTWAYVAASFMAFGGIFLLIHAIRKGDKFVGILAASILFLAASMTVLKNVNKDAIYKIYKLVTAKKTWAGANKTLIGSLTVISIFILFFVYMSDSVEAAILGIAGAIAVLGYVLMTTEKAGKKIVTVLYVIAVIALILINYFTDINEKILQTEKNLYGNSLIPVLYILVDVLKLVFKSIKSVIEGFKRFVDSINWVKDRLTDFKDYVVDIIGNSIIPDSFESGIGRIIDDFEELIDEVHKTEDELNKFAKFSDKLMGNSIIPEAFERGANRIMESLHSIPTFGYGDTPTGAGTPNLSGGKGIVQPTINIDLRGLTTEGKLTPEEIQKLIEKGVEDGLRKVDRRTRRY